MKMEREAGQDLQRPCRGCEVLGFHSERGEKFLEGLREKGQDLTDLIGFLTTVVGRGCRGSVGTGRLVRSPGRLW